jgi:hypothetical protein
VPDEDRNRFWVLAIGFAAASTSGLAILLHVFGLVHLAAAVILLAPMTLLVILAVAMRSNSASREVFVQRCAAGLFAGVMGVVAYDAIRWLILMSGMVPFNPFRAIEVFGLLILQTDVDTPLTKSVGWAFHVWNGLSFATMYTLAVGRGRIWWAIAWSMMLEAAMLSTYPSLFRILLDWPFVTISFIGHLAYGLALGYSARGAVKV